jgi:hypothetical protein
MRELLDGVRDHPSFLELQLTFSTRTDVRLEWGNAKTLLVIEEEVDLGREQVTVIHEWVYEMSRQRVSEKNVVAKEFFSCVSGLTEERAESCTGIWITPPP